MGTKERLTLEEASALTVIAGEHRHRYRLAAAALAGRRVLDLCCGSGYGAFILAETAASVHGVDVDAATVDEAAARVPESTPVSFEAADAVAFLRRPDLAERFDAIVCFEGLEHLEELDDALELLRGLAEAGVVQLLSVPNSRGLGEDNEFHVTDFSWEQAVERIGSFPDAALLTQYLADGSVIVPADAELAGTGGRVVLDDRHDPEYANHYIACIGVAPPGPEAIAQIEVAPVANRYVRDIERANAELRIANNRLWHAAMARNDSGAGSFVAKHEALVSEHAALVERMSELEATHTAFVVEHGGWVERCLAAEAREQALQERLTAAQQRLSPFPVRVAAKLFGR